MDEPEVDQATPLLLIRQPDPQLILAVLEEFMQGDEAEQRETFELLKRSIDENRPEGYKLFS